VTTGPAPIGSIYLELFARIGETLTSAFHLDEDLVRILSAALEAAEARRGRLMLLDMHREKMVVRAVAGQGFAEGEGVGAFVPEGPPPSGMLRVPLVGRGEPVGLLELDLTGGGPLPDDRRRLVVAVAAQAALFVEHARQIRGNRRMFFDIIVSLASAVDAKDAYTHSHTVRVAEVALLLGRRLGVAGREREALLLAALLHDVGKIAIPDAILKKPARLDPDETEIMRGHPAAGAAMLRHVRALRDVVPGIRHHHEHWDGSGYPDGLAGAAIPRSARIILVADAFDALTSNRVYRPGVDAALALEAMRPYSGRQFEPEVFAALETLVREQPPGLAEAERPGEPDLFDLLRRGI